MGGTVTTQTDFRYRNDDGGEPTGSPPTGASWKAAENVDWVPVIGDLDAPFRLRFQISTTGMDEGQKTYTIRLSVNDGSYLAITTTSTNGVISVPSADTSWTINDNDPTTEQMDGSGTFKAGDIDETGTTGDIQIRVNEDTEVEFVLQLDSANLSGGEKLEFRVYGGTSPLDAYTVTPTIASAPTPPSATTVQTAFRIRSDDSQGINANAGWAAALNVGATIDSHIRFRIRFEIEESADNQFTGALDCRVSIGGGAYVDYGVLTEDPSSWATTPAAWFAGTDAYADAAATTDILTGAGSSSKTFTAGEGQDDNTTGTISLKNQHTEIEFAVIIPKLYDGESHHADETTFDFRLYETDGTPLTTYTQTPRVTLNHASGKIGGVFSETPEHAGPWIDTNGNLYVLVEYAETDSLLVILKSVDDGVSWVPVDVAGNPTTNDMEVLSVVQDGDTLKILHHGSGDVVYHEFYTSDHATLADEWGTGSNLDQAVETITGPTIQSASLVQLSGGDLWAFYTASVSGSDLVRYNKRTGTSWGTPASLDATATEVFQGVAAVVDGSDLTYIFYKEDTNGDIWMRDLTSGGSLSGRTLVEGDAGTNADHRSNIVPGWYYDDGGINVIVIAYRDASDGLLYTRYVRNGTLQARSAASDSTILTNPPSGPNSRQPTAHLFLDGKVVYAMYSDLTTGDLFRNENTDEGGWGTATEEMDAVYCVYVRGNVLTLGGGDKIIAYYWENGEDSGTINTDGGFTGGLRYDSIVLEAGGADAMPMAMQTYAQMR